MEIYALKKLLFITFFIFEINILSTGAIEDSTPRSYDVVQLMSRALENIRISQHLETITEDLKSTGLFESNYTTHFNPLRNVLNSDSSKSCISDLEYVAENINLHDPLHSWALKMLDSYGKLESGLLEGNFKWLGDYAECKNVYAPKSDFSDVGGFHGKYCNLQLSIASLPLTVGICLPDTCDPSELTYYYLELLNITSHIPGLEKVMSVANSTSLSCKPNTKQLSNAAIATICVLSIFLLLVLIGSSITVVKYIKAIKVDRSYLSDFDTQNSVNYHADKEEDDVLLLSEGSPTKLSVFYKKCEPFFNCFCIFTNGSKLLNTDATEGQLLSLHGIRFLSMSWVILCHTYAFSFSSVRNLTSILDKIDTWQFQVVLNGFFSVDSFFVLSAFLMAYLYLQDATKRKGNTPWLYFYVHRYLRLTPVYMLVLAFDTTIVPYLGSGPFWPDYDIEPVCQKYWWWNILYINNFAASGNQCMAWSWYLANDMQFFAISPLFLITLWRWPIIGYAILGVFLVGTSTAAFAISYQYNLVTGLGNILDQAYDMAFLARWTVYFDKIYIKPYTRLGPYLVGIALGYYLFRRKLNNRKISFMTLCIGWTISTAVGLACVYGLYHQSPGLVASSFYNAFSRTAYAACLSWVIFVCLSGQGGPVDKILSYKLFIPLSRLTYCAYLIHPIIIIGYIGTLKTTLDFTHPTMVILFLGLLVITYAGSLLVSLIFESPIIRLEKFVRGKFQS